MAKLFKRNGIFQYDFRFQKKRYQGSTFLKNREKAESYVSKFRADLALGLVGLKHRDPPPILSEFLEGKFLEFVRQHCKKPRTKKFYQWKVKQLCNHKPFTQLRLDKIDELAIQAYKDARLSKKLSPSTINGELGTLRRAMIYADDCGLTRYKRIRILPGARTRDYVLSGEMEKAYLAACPYPLKEVAILMLDLGLRPEEAVSLKKTDIDGAQETVTIREGKTANAHRSMPLTARTKEVFTLCSALHPDSPWVFPGSKGQHFTRGSIDNMFTKLRRDNDWPKEFVLYCCRHTFATRLAEVVNGDVFLLMRALGHSNPKMSARYIHPSADYLSMAYKRKEAFDKMLRGEDVTARITTAPEKERI